MVKRKEKGGLPKESKLFKNVDEKKSPKNRWGEREPNYPAVVFLLVALLANIVLLLSLLGVLK